MQLFATFVKNKCNFFNFLLQQKLALLIRDQVYACQVLNVNCLCSGCIHVIHIGQSWAKIFALRCGQIVLYFLYKVLTIAYFTSAHLVSR